MNSEFRRAKEIFQEALELPPAERADFVEKACAGTEALRREVESLLASAGPGAGTLTAGQLPTLVESRVETESDIAASAALGRRIGPWTLVREIGRGGMGSVYLAERSDHEYRGLAALKLIKRGMDTDFIVQRFRSERQILASLSHPNIARLLDGGTTNDGLPYFVMEYIAGKSLTAYCSDERLDLGRRIEIFRTVCAAVQYAHSALVVHRDIKPSNVLVSEDGTVKLLDFGLAKLLDPAEAGASNYKTVSGVPIFTPEYASPEQVHSLPVTTATDIWSLGVVLYELLSGVHPFKREGDEQKDVLRAVVERDPERPSQAAHGTAGPTGSRRQDLEGDLDTIVLTALRKDPGRRYASVERLSDDLRRYLEGRPVSARPDTLAYRAGKFARRHKASVAAALLVVVSLVGGLGAALWQARAARRSEELARRRFEDVRGLAHSLLFELNDEMETVEGSTKARQLLVTRAIEYLDRLSRDSKEDAALQRDLAGATLRVGDIQGGLGIANVGNTSGAVASYRRALALWEGVLAKEPGAEDGARGAAEALQRLSEIEADPREKLQFAERAIARLRPLVEGDPHSVPNRLALQSALLPRADLLNDLGRGEEALAVHKERTEICEAILKDDPSNFRARRGVAVGWYKIGQTNNFAKRWADAVAPYQKARALFGELRPSYPSPAQFDHDVSFCLVDLGSAFVGLSRLDEAVAILREAVAVRERLAAQDTSNAEFKTFLGEARRILGEALVQAGHRAEGERALAATIQAMETLLKADPANARVREVLTEARKALEEGRGTVPGVPGRK